jgi:hypothetical protein
MLNLTCNLVHRYFLWKIKPRANRCVKHSTYRAEINITYQYNELRHFTVGIQPINSTKNSRLLWNRKVHYRLHEPAIRTSSRPCLPQPHYHIWGGLQIMKLLAMQFSRLSCYSSSYRHSNTHFRILFSNSAHVVVVVPHPPGARNPDSQPYSHRVVELQPYN